LKGFDEPFSFAIQLIYFCRFRILYTSLIHVGKDWERFKKDLKYCNLIRIKKEIINCLLKARIIKQNIGDKNKVLNCEKCGKEYSYGRKIYHECDDTILTLGVVFEDSRNYHEWNCVSIIDSNLYQIEEKIIESYLSNSKANSLYVYE